MTSYKKIVLIFVSLIFTSGVVYAQDIRPGETIIYDIKKFFNVGEAVLAYKGPVHLQDKEAIQITVTTKAVNFYDQEDLFLAPQTFYPLMVKRDLNIFGKKEKITEYYDQQKGNVHLVKVAGGKTTEQTLNKKPPIENLYGFIYHFRLNSELSSAKEITLHLPTKDVQMKNQGEAKVNASNKDYDTFFWQSSPKQYSLWFDKQGNKLPVKIDGAVGMTSAVMVLREVK